MWKNRNFLDRVNTTEMSLAWLNLAVRTGIRSGGLYVDLSFTADIPSKIPESILIWVTLIFGIFKIAKRKYFHLLIIGFFQMSRKLSPHNKTTCF